MTVEAVGTFADAATEVPRNIQALLAEQGFPCPRRTNRFTKLALLGAHRCVAERGALPPDASLYLASGQGNVADTAELMQQILRDGLEPQPITFINVSSNMAGYYVANAFGLHGRNIAVSRRAGAWESALELACLDLMGNKTSVALVGAVEECAYPLSMHRHRLNVGVEAALLENSCWLALSVAERDTTPGHAYRRFVTARELLDAMAAFRRAPDTVWLCGTAVERTVVAALEQSWGEPPESENLAGVSDTASAAILAGVLQRRRPSAVVYIAGDGNSGYGLFHFACQRRRAE